MASPTPGPWIYDRDYGVITSECDPDPVAKVFNDADGPLIAAAPEMARICRRLVAACKDPTNLVEKLATTLQAAERVLADLDGPS